MGGTNKHFLSGKISVVYLGRCYICNIYSVREGQSVNTTHVYLVGLALVQRILKVELKLFFFNF